MLFQSYYYKKKPNVLCQIKNNAKATKKEKFLHRKRKNFLVIYIICDKPMIFSMTLPKNFV